MRLLLTCFCIQPANRELAKIQSSYLLPVRAQLLVNNIPAQATVATQPLLSHFS